MTLQAVGISDITSELGQLSKFVQICTDLPEGTYTRDNLTKSVLEILGTKNLNSASRFVTISEKFGLLENLEEVYRLSALGKVLVILAGSDRKVFAEPERNILFIGIMHSPARDQLLTLLQSVSVEGSHGKRAVMKHFFSNDYVKRVWRPAVVNKNLRKLEEGEIPSFFQNKYGCLEHWLLDLQFLSADKDSRLLTSYGKRVLGNKASLQDEARFEMATLGIVYGFAERPFDFSVEKQHFLALFKEGCAVFSGASGLIDMKALRILLAIRFLRVGVLLTANDFDSAVKQLSRDGIVDSVMLGKDGKPAYLTLVNNPNSVRFA